MAGKTKFNITYRKSDNRWMGRYKVVLPDGRKKTQYVYGKTKTEVQNKLIEEMRAAQSGSPLFRNGVTVEWCLKEWLELSSRIRESTKIAYLGEINKYILPAIGKKHLCSLTASDITCFLDKIQREGASGRVAQIIRSILSGALTFATARGYVAKNVVKETEKPYHEAKEIEVWSKEDVGRFREAAKTSKYRLVFELLITYGLRRGEALGLRWSDVDFEHNLIHIRQQYTVCGTSYEVRDPKTKESRRDLPLYDSMRILLAAIAPPSLDDSPVNISEEGGYIKPTSLASEFKRLKKRCGLPDVKLHSLRHFAATGLKEAGVSLRDAQKILGHSSPITTLKHYQHCTGESQREAINKYVNSLI